jgi:hypothetical protein
VLRATVGCCADFVVCALNKGCEHQGQVVVFSLANTWCWLERQCRNEALLRVLSFSVPVVLLWVPSGDPSGYEFLAGTLWVPAR